MNRLAIAISESRDYKYGLASYYTRMFILAKTTLDNWKRKYVILTTICIPLPCKACHIWNPYIAIGYSEYHACRTRTAYIYTPI